MFSFVQLISSVRSLRTTGQAGPSRRYEARKDVGDTSRKETEALSERAVALLDLVEDEAERSGAGRGGELRVGGSEGVDVLA